VVIAGIFEFAGAVLMGSRVTDTVRKGITSEELFNENAATLSLLMIGMCSTIMAVAIWLLVATWLEMPVSTTHSCIGGIIGFALTAKGTDAVNWPKVQQVVMSWFLSPVLSGIIAAILYWFVRCFVLRSKNSVERAYTFYPILIAATLVINTFFIVYKGSPALGLKDTPLGVGIGISFAVGIGSAILLRFLAIPFMRRRVDKLFEDKAVAAAAAATEDVDFGTNKVVLNGTIGARTESYTGA
jgi:sodium-dependent phosphate transporter